MIPSVLLRTLPFMMLLLTCAKDQEDKKQLNEDFDDMVVHYGKHDDVTKAMAIENWESFMKRAHTSFFLTESNLNTLALHIDEASGEDKETLRTLHASCESSLKQSKKELADRNTAFAKELEHYDKEMQWRNEAFKERLRKQMVEVNEDMENVLENE